LHWSEQLAAESALAASTEAIKDLPAVDEDLMNTALRLLRLWSAHPNVKQGVSPYTDGSGECTPKYLTWKSYYDLLSAILQNDLAYIPPASGPERQQLATEIRRVELIYEASLLRETKFPTADTENTQIESWVEQVIRNWEILCGPQWNDEELGEGGQNAVGRNVLDVGVSIEAWWSIALTCNALDPLPCRYQDIPLPLDTAALISCSFGIGRL
jgi:hypothetical protein